MVYGVQNKFININKMLSKEPIDISRIDKEKIDYEVLRLGMIAELDAISLYEQLAAITKDENIKKVFLDIAKEEKTHMGEFQRLLLNRDSEQANEIEEAKKEVEELIGE